MQCHEAATERNGHTVVLCCVVSCCVVAELKHPGRRKHFANKWMICALRVCGLSSERSEAVARIRGKVGWSDSEQDAAADQVFGQSSSSFSHHGAAKQLSLVAEDPLCKPTDNPGDNMLIILFIFFMPVKSFLVYRASYFLCLMEYS